MPSGPLNECSRRNTDDWAAAVPVRARMLMRPAITISLPFDCLRCPRQSTTGVTSIIVDSDAGGLVVRAAAGGGDINQGLGDDERVLARVGGDRERVRGGGQ